VIVNFSIPVDAGCIVLIDSEEIKDYLGDDPTRMDILEAVDTTVIQGGPRSVEVDPGFYSITYKIAHWQGDDRGNDRGNVKLHVPSGKIIVADLCHIIDPEKWQDFLTATDCLRSFPNPSRAHVINTGGDGNFTLNLNIKSMEKGGK